MTASAFHDISKIEDSLWKAADQLRANSKLTSFIEPIVGQLKAPCFADQRLLNARDLLLPRLMSGEITV